MVAADNKLHVKGVVEHSVLQKKIGNGCNTRFWKDFWLGDFKLEDQFPRLALVDINPECTVADRWTDEGWSWQWAHAVTRGVVHSQLVGLMGMLDGFRCGRGPDVWRWALDDDGIFSVAATRRWIDKCVLPSNDRATRWCRWVPRKVNIFIWRLLLERIPTRIALKDRGMEIDNLKCSICGLADENVFHLFGECVVAVPM